MANEIFADGFDTSDISDEEYVRLCYDDPLWFMQACERIVDKQTKRLVPFVLSKEQRMVHDAFWWLWCNNKPVRIIVLKARQLGISTWSQGIGYWMSSTRPHTKALVLAHEKETTKHIFQMSDRFSIYDQRNVRGLMPKVRRSSQHELTFGNPSKRDRAADPGLDSSITIATADNKNAGHGWTGSFFQGSEVSRWPRPDLLSGVLNALTEAPHTFGILESTAYGSSGVFYETWEKAVEGTNGWLPVFLPWNGREEYCVGLTAKEVANYKPTREEEKLIERYGLSYGQIEWRRRKINGPECQGQGRDAVDVFREQYPLSPEEAFVSSGLTFFDMGTVVDWEASIRQRDSSGWPKDMPGAPESKRMTISIVKPPGPVKPSSISAVEDPDGIVEVYYLPEPKKDYIIGADVAAGYSAASADWSVAYVLERMTLKVCAKIRGKIHPDKYGDELVKLGWFYNEAFIAPEANSVGITCARRVATEYARCAYSTKLDQFAIGEIDEDKPGFYTTTANRKQLFWTLRALIRENKLICWDRDFWRECHDFVVPEDSSGRVKEDSPRARLRRHDDCVMAMAIGTFANNPAISGPIIVQEEKVPVVLGTFQGFMKAEQDQETKKREQSFFDEHVGLI